MSEAVPDTGGPAFDAVRNLELASNWRERARCKGADPSTFYPENDEDPVAAEAKFICETCVVREYCLEYAITAREKIGVWGGYTAKERRRLVRQRRNAG